MGTVITSTVIITTLIILLIRKLTKEKFYVSIIEDIEYAFEKELYTLKGSELHINSVKYNITYTYMPIGLTVIQDKASNKEYNATNRLTPKMKLNLISYISKIHFKYFMQENNHV
tara:strand:- start:1529 stop:1873 length:345 start_codon:yes stop_codon:yes gene_type:complete